METGLVLVVDYGAQYAQLIARRVREAHVYSEIVPSSTPVAEMLARGPAAIILSGGPSSVYAPGAPQTDAALFTADVPVGFDALHCQLQAEVVAGQQDAPDAIAACARSVARAAQLLTPFGAGPEAARLTAVLYLADIATRYLTDHQEQAGQRLGAPGRWLIPAIRAAMAAS